MDCVGFVWLGCIIMIMMRNIISSEVLRVIIRLRVVWLL